MIQNIHKIKFKEDNDLQGMFISSNFPIQKMLFYNTRKLSALTDCSSKDSSPILQSLQKVTRTFGEAENIEVVSDYELEDEDKSEFDSEEDDAEGELSFNSEVDDDEDN